MGTARVAKPGLTAHPGPSDRWRSFTRRHVLTQTTQSRKTRSVEILDSVMGGYLE